jgi:hypothetical protein
MTGSAVDVRHPAAAAANHVMVVVADPAFEPRCRSGGPDSPYQPSVGQEIEGVIHGLTGDPANLRSYDIS